MKNQNKIMACVDQSRFADYVTDYAAWVAKKMHAPLEILHIIDSHPETSDSEDYSGTIGFDTQEDLLKSLSEQDALRNKIAREKGRLFLNQLRLRAIDGGVTATDVRQRHGGLVESLVEQTAHVQLVVLGRRGESADLRSDESLHKEQKLGRHLEEVVRQIKQPILTITQAFTEPKNSMIAFDGGAVTRKGIELIATSPLFKGLSINVLMLGQETRETIKQLNWAQEKLEAAQLKPKIFLKSGEAKTVAAQFIQAHDIHLMVMGAYSHSPLRNFLFGSKTAGLLHATTIPVLLLR
jgi:nucleotide-binding universal stress UspA family protein